MVSIFLWGFTGDSDLSLKFIFLIYLNIWYHTIEAMVFFFCSTLS